MTASAMGVGSGGWCGVGGGGVGVVVDAAQRLEDWMCVRVGWGENILRLFTA